MLYAWQLIIIVRQALTNLIFIFMNNFQELSWWPELEKIVEQEIRPSLQMDGGDLRLVDFDETTGVLKVELQGHCAHCPMSEYTLKAGIETELKARLPQIKEVQAA